MMTDPFLNQLASLCQANPTTAKWVIVPSHGIGRTIGERLALEGAGWVNLRFVTPLGLALTTAAPVLVRAGIHPLPDGLGSSLLMRLLMERPADAPSYFRPLADQPQMGAALWRTISELRLAGLGSNLPAEPFGDAGKHAELSGLLAAYEEHLASERKADAADLFRVAREQRSQSPIGRDDLVIEAPGLGPQLPLVRAFLDGLPGRHVAAAQAEIPGLMVPRRMRGQAPDAVGAAVPRTTPDAPPDTVPDAPPDSVPDAAPHAAPCALPFSSLLEPGERCLHISLFHAAGREAEVESVLRRIVSAGIPFDQVEVVCAAADAAPLFWEKAQCLELPVTLEEGVPITATRPARALLAFCDWIESGFVAGRLRRLLQAGDLTTGRGKAGADAGEEGGERDLLAPSSAARLLSRAEATWGRETYERSLAALAARYRAEADDGERTDESEREALRKKADEAEWMAAWVEELLDLVPEPDADGTVLLSEVCEGFRTLIASHLPAASAIDHATLEAMSDGLAKLQTLRLFRCPLRQALAFIRDVVSRRSAAASRPRPSHLHLSTLATAGYAGRPFTCVVGLEEGAVFPALIEDPVLLDEERQRIEEWTQTSGRPFASPVFLPTSHDRLQESVHAAVSRLAALPVPAASGSGGVTFSYSCRDLRDGRETAPSWLMLQAFRLMKGDPALTYADLQAALPPVPETLLPSKADEALSESRWWLASIRGAGDRAMDAVFEAYPSLLDGRIAEDSRASDEFTEFDGFVPEAAALLDPRRSERGISVTRLESLVSCPYRYFLKYGLGVEVLEEDPDGDEWLDPLQRGTLLHAVYARLSREARTRGERLHPIRDGERGRVVADEELAALRSVYPPPTDLVFEAEREEVLRDVDLFLDFEANRMACEPVAFEVAFGHGDGLEEEPLAQAEPVEISLGKGVRVRVRGTIDRINRLPDGSYEVIDYKTGGYRAGDYTGTFNRGARLQHALYGLAAARLLRQLEGEPKVVRGAYEFPSARGGGERVAIAAPSTAAVTRVLTDLIDVIEAGLFLPARDGKSCERCDFTRDCDQPTDEAEGKLENEENAMLEPFRRLLQHD